MGFLCSSDIWFKVSTLGGVYVSLYLEVARIPEAWVFRNTRISLTRIHCRTLVSNINSKATLTHSKL